MINIIIKVVNRGLLYLFKIYNRLKLKSYGNQVIVGGNSQLIGSFFLRVKKGGVINLGNNLTISSGLCYNPINRNIRTALFVEKGAKLTIGDNVGISGSCLWAHQSIIIGNNVKIGGDSLIIDSDCHSLNYQIRCTSDDQKCKSCMPICIEDDVLIGARSIILKGVTIGARSIIGAGSVVTRSIPPDEIWAGNPARFIKKT